MGYRGDTADSDGHQRLRGDDSGSFSPSGTAFPKDKKGFKVDQYVLFPSFFFSPQLSRCLVFFLHAVRFRRWSLLLLTFDTTGKSLLAGNSRSFLPLLGSMRRCDRVLY